MIIEPALGTNIRDCTRHILADKAWRVTEKIDGVRRLFYKNQQGFVSATSRTNKKDIWLGHITSYLEAPWFPSNRVYDCELVDRKLYFERVDSFILRSETAGKANQQYPDNKQDLMAICFDMFEPGSTADGRDRNQELFHYFGNESLSNPVIMVPQFGVIFGEDNQTLDCLMAQVRSYNGEGLMLMDLNEPYIPNKSKSLIKVKRLEEYIGEIVDIEMATPGTKIDGGIASIIVKVQGCTVPVRVGSGFNQEERLKYAADGNSLLGQHIEIEAFSRSRDSKGNVSLSMPIFKQFVKERA